MNISHIENTSIENLRARLVEAVAPTRFTADIYQVSSKLIKITKVRLKEKKSYCGNHPKSCEFKGHDHKHKRATYLEGADWVEFNDILNEVCDFLRVSCRIETSVCRIRWGKDRRINYTADTQQFGNGTWAWDKIGNLLEDYKNMCGQESPPSKFPIGTPGIYTKLEYDCVG